MSIIDTLILINGCSSSTNSTKNVHDYKGHFLDDVPCNSEDIYSRRCEERYSQAVCDILHQEMPDCIDMDSIDRIMEKSI